MSELHSKILNMTCPERAALSEIEKLLYKAGFCAARGAAAKITEQDCLSEYRRGVEHCAKVMGDIKSLGHARTSPKIEENYNRYLALFSGGDE